MTCKILAEGFVDPLSDMEKTLRELAPGQYVTLRLIADQAAWDLDEGIITQPLDLVSDDGSQKFESAFRLSPLLMDMVGGTVVEATMDRIKLRPCGYEEERRPCSQVQEGAVWRGTNHQLLHLDLPFYRTGRDLAYADSYSLGFGRPAGH